MWQCLIILFMWCDSWRQNKANIVELIHFRSQRWVPPGILDPRFGSSYSRCFYLALWKTIQFNNVIWSRSTCCILARLARWSSTRYYLNMCRWFATQIRLEVALLLLCIVFRPRGRLFILMSARRTRGADIPQSKIFYLLLLRRELHSFMLHEADLVYVP